MRSTLVCSLYRCDLLVANGIYWCHSSSLIGWKEAKCDTNQHAHIIGPLNIDWGLKAEGQAASN